MWGNVKNWFGDAASWLGNAASDAGEFILDLPNRLYEYAEEADDYIYGDGGVTDGANDAVRERNMRRAQMTVGGFMTSPVGILVVGIIAYLLLRK